MLELYLEEPNKLTLKDAKPLPPPGDDQVKIRVIYGGICGSDLRVYQGTISYATYPLRPGHEVLGRVVEAGRGTGLEPGTKVVVFPNTFCGECEFCRSGKTNICPAKKPLGVSTDGVFAQEIIVPAKYTIPVPEALSDARAVLIEPFAVTVHALKKARIAPGTSLAVVGCGTEGLLALALATKRGAKVTAVDINPAKLAIAKSLGDVRNPEPGLCRRRDVRGGDRGGGRQGRHRAVAANGEAGGRHGCPGGLPASRPPLFPSTSSATR